MTNYKIKCFQTIIFLFIFLNINAKEKKTPNILLIIADDIGKDALNGFYEGSIKPKTPNIDALRKKGISFQNFWVNPTCSPTRASIITGKYGFRTNVTKPGDVLSNSGDNLFNVLKEKTRYSTALIGKWHLSGRDKDVNLLEFGMDYFSGTLSGGVKDYYDWINMENGQFTKQEQYVTKVSTNKSIEWIRSQKEDKPWFLWLAYNAPHTPFHAPPIEMHSQGDLKEYSKGVNPLKYYLAAIEAMDYQIGKLISSIPKNELTNTVIVFLGDNGSPSRVAQNPYSRFKSKGSLYEGGINMPLFICGNGIGNKRNYDLVTSTDLYASILSMAGIDVELIHDSYSFTNILYNKGTNLKRTFNYSLSNNPDMKGECIRNKEYKLIRYETGLEELYNLKKDPHENVNLLSGSNGLNKGQLKVIQKLRIALKEIKSKEH